MSPVYHEDVETFSEEGMKRMEPFMDELLEPYHDDIAPGTPYDDLDAMEKAQELVDIVRGEHQVRDDVTYNAEDDPGATGTEFSIPELYHWIRSVRGAPHDGTKRFEEVGDAPDRFRTGTEAAQVRERNREPMLGESEEPKETGGRNPWDDEDLALKYGRLRQWSGIRSLSATGTMVVEQDAADPDPEVGEPGETTLEFAEW